MKTLENIENSIVGIENRISIFNKFAWGLVFLGTIICISGLLAYNLSSELSEFADFMGGTTATIWSLAGLLFVYIAFLGQQNQLSQQRIELRYNREELELHREELKKQRIQFELQNEYLNINQFNERFYRMISYHKDNVNQWRSTRIKKQNGKVIEKRETIGQEDISKQWMWLYDSFKATPKIQIQGERGWIIQVVNRLPFDILVEQGQYFRYVKHIIDFVNESDYSNEAKEKYFYTFFLQLSDYEVMFLRTYFIFEGEFDYLEVLAKYSGLLKIVKAKFLKAKFY